MTRSPRHDALLARRRRRHRRAAALLAVCAVAGAAAAQPAPPDEAASSSLMARAIRAAAPPAAGAPPTPGHSLFHVPPPEPRLFAKHDLIEIIVRESSRAESTQELETDKEFSLEGAIEAFPNLRLEDLVQFRLFSGRDEDLPELKMGLLKEFSGEGDYERTDDLIARLTAEVIEVLPNGNLVLEARTEIRTDDEQSIMKVTGICRPEDVTPANSVLSNQVHDLKIEKVHEGELRKTTRKGVIAQFFDALFAW